MRTLMSRIERIEAHVGGAEDMVWVTTHIRIPGTSVGYWVPKSLASGQDKIVIARSDPRYLPPCLTELRGKGG
jgi:hypothetical protein